MAFVSLDRPSLVFTKNSVNNMDPGNQKFCRDLVEYIDMSCISSDDDFFYDMMKFIRFMKVDGVAYTDENGLIVLNPPQNFKSLPEWDFIYDHECMHQLWDTFGVGDKIKASGQKYDHMILNIASDCVINDYLDYYRKKTVPGGPKGGLVTPESLKEKYGVEYDRKNDTQYSLYVKIMKAIQEDPAMASKMKQDFGKLEPKSVTYVPPQGGGGSQQKHSPDFIKGWCDAINDVFKGKVDPLKYNPVNFMSFAAKTSKSADWQAGYDAAMEQIRIGLEQGIQVSQGDPGGGGSDLPQIPWDIPQQDQDQIDDMDGPSQRGDYEGYADLSPEELSDIEKDLIRSGAFKNESKTAIGRYLGQNGGFIGNFLKKCRSSKEMKESGLATDSGQKKTNWGAKVFNDMDNFISEIVREHKLQYKRTYSRFKRGAMVPEPGEFLAKGKQSVDEKFPISIAFWVDCSGSMGSGTNSDLYRACKCMYALADAIEKEWSNESLISEFDFEFYSWDTSIYPLKKNQMHSSGGSTMSLDELVRGMMDRKNYSMINIVITDGGGGLGGSTFNKYIKGMGGLVIFVTNSPALDVKRMADQCEELSYVEAPSDFSLN